MPITANLCHGDGGGDRSCGSAECGAIDPAAPPHLTADTDFRSLAR